MTAPPHVRACVRVRARLRTCGGAVIVLTFRCLPFQYYDDVIGIAPHTVVSTANQIASTIVVHIAVTFFCCTLRTAADMVCVCIVSPTCLVVFCSCSAMPPTDSRNRDSTLVPRPASSDSGGAAAAGCCAAGGWCAAPLRCMSANRTLSCCIRSALLSLGMIWRLARRTGALHEELATSESVSLVQKKKTRIY